MLGDEAVSVAGDLEAAVPQLRGARWAVGAVCGIILAALLLFFLVWWIFVHPRQQRAAIAGARVDAAVANGTAAAATDALKLQVIHDHEIVRIDTVTQENDRAIHAAAGADASSPDVARALHDALCLRDAYRGQPDCAAVPGPGDGLGIAAADAGSGEAAK